MALTAAAFIITAVCIQFMADSVPMHYNFHGEIDRYGSKNENFIFPCFIAVFNIFWVIFMNVFGRRADRAQEEKARVEAAGNLKVLGFTAIGTTIMFIIIQFVMLLVDINASEGQDRMPIDINVISNCCLGLIFIVIGNIIPKCKRNSVIGVRTSWSMDNDTTWELSKQTWRQADNDMRCSYYYRDNRCQRLCLHGHNAGAYHCNVGIDDILFLCFLQKIWQ